MVELLKVGREGAASLDHMDLAMVLIRFLIIFIECQVPIRCERCETTCLYSSSGGNDGGGDIG